MPEYHQESAMQHSPITLVTAYFELEDPLRGRTAHTYYDWMANLLPFIRWPMIIFCDEQSVDTVKRLRGQNTAVYCVTSLEEFYVYRHRDIIHAHVAQRYPGLNPDLSLIHHEKANFVRGAIGMDAFGSEMFFWCDIGLFRSNKRQAVFHLSDRIEWPNLRACRSAFGNKTAFFGFTGDSAARVSSPWLFGGLWGGPGKPTHQFCDAYYDLLDYLVGIYSSSILEGAAVPRGRGFPAEEALFYHLNTGALRDPCAESRIQSADMRVFTEDAIHWPRRLKQLKKVPLLSWRYLAILYCLNADRFPWAYLGREISLLVCTRHIAREAVHSLKRRKPGKGNK